MTSTLEQIVSAPRAARREDLEPARTLLDAAGLPLAGLEEHFLGFRVLDAPGCGLAGVAGAERYDAAWLLRSLVVHPAFQGRGHGRALLASVLADARRAGVRDVFLLTTDAQPFFAAHGFTEAPPLRRRPPCGRAPSCRAPAQTAQASCDWRSQRDQHTRQHDPRDGARALRRRGH